MEANAALRNIGAEGHRARVATGANAGGTRLSPGERHRVAPTAEDLARLDRKRKGKKLSNQDWVSKSDPEAKIAKMKDGTTHLALQARARGGRLD